MAFYPEQILDTIALCEGYDGIGLGFFLIEPAYRNICGVEREAYAVANMVKKTKEIFMDEKPQWSDVSIFRIPRLRGLVDCITAGIPCQPFSYAGKQLGTADKRWIWPSIFRIIQDIRPRILFFEEVPGFKKHGLPILLQDIAKIGYDATWDNFRAPDVEAPHKKRERIFILARLADAKCSERRPPTEGRINVKNGTNINREKTSSKFGTNRDDKELDNPQCRSINSGQKRIRRTAGADTDGTGSQTRLAFSDNLNNDDARFRTSEIRRKRSEQTEIFGSMADPDCENRIWPSRDGEPQYGWEPPRTINVKSKQCGNKDWLLPAEPTLGRDAYGITSRVDELRLCGNGVIPAMAGLAWFVLKTILIENGIW